MKRILCIAVLTIFCYTAKSQVLISLILGDKLNTGNIEFGLDGGLNMSAIQGADQGKYAKFFNLGFYFDIRTKNPNWYFHTGVIVKSSMGMDHLPLYPLNNDTLDNAFSDGHVDRKLAYFNVPFMMKYKLGHHFFAEAGPMLALRTKCFDTFTKEIKEEDDLTYQLKVSDSYHRIDAGLMGGVGYRLMGGNGMNLGVRYYLGLMNISTDPSTPKMYNRSIYFVVGIPIGAGKAAKKQGQSENKG